MAPPHARLGVHQRQSNTGLTQQIGLAEYVFFLMSVVGLLVLRRRDDPRATPRYSTWVGNPVIFSIVSGLLVLRGVLTDPLQGLAIVLVGSLGLGVFYLKARARPFPLVTMV